VAHFSLAELSNDPARWSRQLFEAGRNHTARQAQVRAADRRGRQTDLF